MNDIQQSVYWTNGLLNAHRTEPVRDGRRKVVSRVRDIPFPPSPTCKKLSDKARVELNEQIETLFPKITPPMEFSLVREDLLARLRSIIANEWEGADINVYGSAGNSLGLLSADVDMSLYIPQSLYPFTSSSQSENSTDDGKDQVKEKRNDSETNGHSVLNGLNGFSHGNEYGRMEWARRILLRLSEIMEMNGIKILRKFLEARVPVIKMLDPISKLQIDVCVNNTLAVLNTNLIDAYVELDERFRYVCILVKYWAKRRDLNDTYHGTLSSYAYTLLTIHYLQTLDDPVLPCLQRMKDGKQIENDEDVPIEMTSNGGGPELYNTYFDRSVNQSNYSSTNEESVHELLLGFFHYYAYVFQYRTDLASIRLGKRTSREVRQWHEEAVNNDEWDPTKSGVIFHPIAETTAPAIPKATSAASGNLPSSTKGGSTSDKGSDRVSKRPITGNGSKTKVSSDDDGEEDDDDDGNDTSSSNSISNAKDNKAEDTEKKVQGPSESDKRKDGASRKVDEKSKVEKRARSKSEMASANVANNNTSNTTASSGVNNGMVMPQRPRVPSKHLFCIEDPFDIDHDLSRGMEKAAVTVIRQEMMRAYEILAETGDFIAACDEYG